MTEAKLIQMFPDEDINLLLEIFEERAAIREYDGGYSRQEAEELALEDLKTIFAD